MACQELLEGFERFLSFWSPLEYIQLLEQLRLGPWAGCSLRIIKAVLVSELATLTSPNPALPLLLYIAASPNAVSAALVQERCKNGRPQQCPVYFVSEVLTNSKCNMTEPDKIAYTAITASRKLRHYFEAHRIKITTDRGLGDLFRNPETSTRIVTWAAELFGYSITFEPRIAIKSQVLADFHSRLDRVFRLTQAN
jgi:hypothetical protein